MGELVVLLTMATVKHAIAGGTAGAVISVYDDTLLVEITGPDGKTVDMLQAQARQLKAKRP